MYEIGLKPLTEEQMKEQEEFLVRKNKFFYKSKEKDEVLKILRKAKNWFELTKKLNIEDTLNVDYDNDYQFEMLWQCRRYLWAQIRDDTEIIEIMERYKNG